MVAFLRTVPAVENDPGKSEYRMPLPPAAGPPVESVARPAGPDRRYGAYLAGPWRMHGVPHAVGPEGPSLGTAPAAGRIRVPRALGRAVAPNITSSADGLAGYSDDDIAKMITEGGRPDGSRDAAADAYGHFARMTPATSRR